MVFGTICVYVIYCFSTLSVLHSLLICASLLFYKSKKIPKSVSKAVILFENKMLFSGVSKCAAGKLVVLWLYMFLQIMISLTPCCKADGLLMVDRIHSQRSEVRHLREQNDEDIPKQCRTGEIIFAFLRT